MLTEAYTLNAHVDDFFRSMRARRARVVKSDRVSKARRARGHREGGRVAGRDVVRFTDGPGSVGKTLSAGCTCMRQRPSLSL